MRRVRCRFDEAKATQVAAILVQKSGGNMSHLALVKLLYIIDREALAKWGRPVIGGSYYSLPHGPVISEVLDLMKRIEGWDEASFWTEHLTKVGNEMHLLSPAGDDELSPALSSPSSSANAETPSSIFGDKYPNQTFTGWIPAGTPLASDASLQLLQGKTVKITGRIELYHGKPEIKILSRDQLVSIVAEKLQLH